MPDCAVLSGKSRNRLIQQVEDRPLNRPSHQLGQGLDLLPGVPGKTNEAITH
jgi:hypothetical protein